MNLTEIERNIHKERFIKILLFILIFIMAIRLPLDSDFWWHIRTGQLSVINNSPVLQDLTSFTVFSQPWINHSWLSQVIYFEIFELLGYLGVMIFVAFLATLSIFFVFLRLKSNVLTNSFVVILCALTVAVVWSPRPQLISLLFFSILLYVIEEIQFKKNLYVYIWVLFLFLLWGNLHAGFSIGIIYLLGKLCGKFLDILFSDQTENKVVKKDILLLIGVIISSSLVVLINPNGINIWKVQFNTISIPSLQNLIPEWASPNFHELYQQPFLWIWLLLIFFLMRNKSKYSFETIIPLIILGGLGFISRRNYVYFSIFAIPILGDEINRFFDYSKNHVNWIGKINARLGKANKLPDFRFTKIINLTMVAILIFVIFGKIIFLGSPVVYQSYLEKSYPVEIVNILNEKDLQNLKCLNSYTWGGYLSWEIPELPIFIDGRTDLYGEKIIQDWLVIVNASENWKTELEKYQINCIILEPERPIVNQLKVNSWKLIYENEYSVLLLK